MHGPQAEKRGDVLSRRAGSGTICIGAMYENRKLVRWYERQGFSITGTRKFAHLPFVVCFMEKSV